MKRGSVSKSLGADEMDSAETVVDQRGTKRES